MKNVLRIVLALTLVFVMAFSFTACGDENTSSLDTTATQNSSSDYQSENQTSADNSTTVEGVVKAEIVIKKHGTIKLDLYADEVPETVANFVKLAKSGFYNGLTFHRIMEDFMMQGGDPNGDGTGGSDKDIKGEFSANGHRNNISHIRGTISMARSGSQYEQYLSMGYKLSDLPSEAQSDLKRAYNSGSSQFFICHKDSTFLDGNYAAFGRVTEGMNIVDKICTEAKPTDNNGTIPAKDQPVIETIKIIE
ncbi:MAG: peptidylprolyl isomerase [Clostridia bacterium]|nr:peptidylprolyl isomerase [Clostridia bacterium]